MSKVFNIYSHIPKGRAGQLMSNFEQWLKTEKGIDIFYLADDRFILLLDEYLKGGDAE